MTRSTLNRILPLLVAAFLAAMFWGRQDIQDAIVLPLMLLGAIWLFFVVLSMARNVRSF